MSASVAPSSQAPSTWTAGAPPQAARHSTRLTVNFPSALVPPSEIPSLRQVDWSRPSAPPSEQERVVQNSSSVSPSGWKRYIA
jgi:hypothetical protein